LQSSSADARSTPSPEPSSWSGTDRCSGRLASWKRFLLGTKRRHGKHCLQVVIGEVDPAAEKVVSAGNQAIGGGVSDLLVENVIDARGGENVLKGLDPERGAEPRIAQLLDRKVEGVQLEGQRVVEEVKVRADSSS